MEIRQAVSTDSPSLSSLCMDVQSLHAENHPDVFKMPPSDDFAVSFFDEVRADPSTYLYIAEENGELVGYVLCKLIERPENPFTFARRHLLVDQISVRPNSRGRGVGVALIEQAGMLARELGVSKIQLDSWSFNTGAHRFFEKLGFKKFNHRFWRDL